MAQRNQSECCTRPTFAWNWHDFACHQIARLHTHKAMGSRRKEHDARIFNILLQRCRCRSNHVQQMQVPLFIQRMQVTVLQRWCGDGVSCHAHAELRAANKQCAKIPRRDIKACHFQLSLHKSRRVCGRLQPVNYEESRACPKVTGPMTMQERKSTWPQKDRARICSR